MQMFFFFKHAVMDQPNSDGIQLYIFLGVF